METRILHAAMFTPGIGGKWGLPLILIGDPGTAKTSIIVREAVESGLHVEVLIASLRDPTDFLGLMVAGVTKATKAKDIEGHYEGVTYIPPAWAVRAAKAKRSLVFIDEINSAPPSVQAALNRVTLERVVGDFELPDTVRIMAARNEVDDASGGYELSAALDNRFGQMHWKGPDFPAWRSYILGGMAKTEMQAIRNAEDEEARVSAAWDGAYASASGLVLSFLEKHISRWKATPGSGARASMRTWDMVIHALAGARVHGLSDEETDTFLASFVGEPTIVEFRSWQAAMDLPDPALLLDGQVSFQPDPDRVDRTMVVLLSCAALVSPQTAEKRTERASALWRLLKANMGNADICYAPAMALADPRVRLVRSCPEAIDVMARFAPMMASAGMI